MSELRSDGKLKHAPPKRQASGWQGREEKAELGIEIGSEEGVAAAGASRTYRRAYPAASDLVGIYEDVGTGLNGPRASPRFNSQPLYPVGRRYALSEHPPGVISSN